MVGRLSEITIPNPEDIENDETVHLEWVRETYSKLSEPIGHLTAKQLRSKLFVEWIRNFVCRMMVGGYIPPVNSIRTSSIVEVLCAKAAGNPRGRLTVSEFDGCTRVIMCPTPDVQLEEELVWVLLDTAQSGQIPSEMIPGIGPLWSALRIPFSEEDATDIALETQEDEGMLTAERYHTWFTLRRPLVSRGGGIRPPRDASAQLSDDTLSTHASLSEKLTFSGVAGSLSARDHTLRSKEIVSLTLKSEWRGDGCAWTGHRDLEPSRTSPRKLPRGIKPCIQRKESVWKRRSTAGPDSSQEVFNLRRRSSRATQPRLSKLPMRGSFFGVNRKSISPRGSAAAWSRKSSTYEDPPSSCGSGMSTPRRGSDSHGDGGESFSYRGSFGESKGVNMPTTGKRRSLEAGKPLTIPQQISSDEAMPPRGSFGNSLVLPGGSAGPNGFESTGHGRQGGGSFGGGGSHLLPAVGPAGFESTNHARLGGGSYGGGGSHLLPGVGHAGFESTSHARQGGGSFGAGGPGATQLQQRHSSFGDTTGHLRLP